ncbi:hypothetical protein F441_01715 [Phytophthora nicotianae CJ01A1]|uniref:Uncharacterized protein n=6 Tax=Phytophthora nicotianae TaxID=4792 RepID=W2QTL6_PHYN3|nr:hypothetical protein PPTG_21973 [Phytophthora nicotianae INRA-310]ETI55575.1 hypothetical protein F443_01749 [Phytophthora nicotianae P1569]ETK95405.1 hypothetical protein L915_01668 [Phytophthora nicotianae]ETO84336.1 hypothetical protein F444_01750 [Phytophthora nicotianae P1976]ETP25379.1 hypothetical protein F441_01715 [Phytophthora nicotianae CJ01A1]ETP53408.1 hypothetical protein F442_01693 [Phytophthora nicotianae P10297]
MSTAQRIHIAITTQTPPSHHQRSCQSWNLVLHVFLAPAPAKLPNHCNASSHCGRCNAGIIDRLHKFVVVEESDRNDHT